MAFEQGVIVFFRALDRNDALTRSVHPNGRNVEFRSHIGHPEDYVILDERNEVIGVYPRDWVACILPLITVGPQDVANQPPRRDSASPPEEGDPQGFPGRAKRFNS